MSRYTWGFWVFLAIYMSFAQPGIPPCWLKARACEIHVHLSKQHEETPHPHDYLFDLSKTNSVPVLPTLLVPISLILANLFDSRIFRQLFTPLLVCFDPYISLDPPPPRQFPSS